MWKKQQLNETNWTYFCPGDKTCWSRCCMKTVWSQAKTVTLTQVRFYYCLQHTRQSFLSPSSISLCLCIFLPHHLLFLTTKICFWCSTLPFAASLPFATLNNLFYPLSFPPQRHCAGRDQPDSPWRPGDHVVPLTKSICSLSNDSSATERPKGEKMRRKEEVEKRHLYIWYSGQEILESIHSCFYPSLSCLAKY